jgi:hypothetical protein
MYHTWAHTVLFLNMYRRAMTTCSVPVSTFRFPVAAKLTSKCGAVRGCRFPRDTRQPDVVRKYLKASRRGLASALLSCSSSKGGGPKESGSVECVGYAASQKFP